MVNEPVNCNLETENRQRRADDSCSTAHVVQQYATFWLPILICLQIDTNEVTYI